VVGSFNCRVVSRNASSRRPNEGVAPRDCDIHTVVPADRSHRTRKLHNIAPSNQRHSPCKLFPEIFRGGRQQESLNAFQEFRLPRSTPSVTARITRLPGRLDRV
jgi:hypothetical protein